MTTIILATLGVVLAASAALMTIYYGDFVSSQGTIRAKAATLENAAMNIQAAMTGRSFRGVRVAPESLAELYSHPNERRWLSRLPDVSQAGGRDAHLLNDAGDTLYIVPGISEAVCARVNKNYGRSGSIPVLRASEPRGCYRDVNGEFVFFSVLR